MAEVESAWAKYPDYVITVSPLRSTVRVWHGELLVAESDDAKVLAEQDHVDRLYVPEADVRWEHFEATEHRSVCPFKGEAVYWSLTAGSVPNGEAGSVPNGEAGDEPLENVAWAYRTPFDEVRGIEGHVSFYDDRVRIEVVDRWPASLANGGDGHGDGTVTTHRFPTWGDASDLLRLIDVQPADGSEDDLFVAPPYPTKRNVVEGGQILAASVVAASKALPDQRVTSASMIFTRSASFDDPLDFHVDVLRRGRTFSTAEVRVVQHDKLRSVGLLLLDSGSPDVIRGVIEMPDVPGPDDSVQYDFGVTGRDLRVVDGMYSGDPERVGPPVINTWVRFRDDPGPQYLHAALMTQSTTHWTIAAGLLPHQGFGEDQAHVTLSTGPMATTIAYHDDVDVTEWLLYSNPAVYAGRGLVQGEGHVFTQDGRLVATYTLQAMVRAFNQDPSAIGLDSTNAM
jgi:acyl-CoA thioesterase II